MTSDQFKSEWSALDDQDKADFLETLALTWENSLILAVNKGLMAEAQSNVPDRDIVTAFVQIPKLLKIQAAIHRDGTHPNLWAWNKSAMSRHLAEYTLAYSAIEGLHMFLFLRGNTYENFRLDDFDLEVSRYVVGQLAEMLYDMAVLKYAPFPDLEYPDMPPVGYRFHLGFMIDMD